MSAATTPRKAWARSIARREASDRLASEQRRIVAYLTTAALTPGRFIHRHVMRQDYLAAAEELRKLMSR